MTPPSPQSVFSHRRIRNVTAVQVRNLTPFPVRDAFASALSQPSDQPQFSTTGHLVDDLDVTLQMRRSRRISLNSVHTLRSIRSDEDSEDISYSSASPGDLRGRRRTNSRVSFSGTPTGQRPSASVSGHKPTPSSKRPRTSSMASSKSTQAASANVGQTSLNLGNMSVSSSSLFSDTSQTGMEKVVSSRLVETFISITIPFCPNDSDSSSEIESHASPPTTPLTPQTPNAKSHRRMQSETHKASVNALPSPPRSKRSSSKPNKQPAINGSPTTPSRVRTNGKEKVGRPPQLQLFSSNAIAGPSSQQIPNYISPIHRPSTNPCFFINADIDFGNWVELSATKLKIEIFGKVGEEWPLNDSFKSKGKEKEAAEPIRIRSPDGWRVLKDWYIDLDQMVPLSDEAGELQFLTHCIWLIACCKLAAHPSHLPSNSLLLKFSPAGPLFYLPSPPSRERSQSPTAGYSSDPEPTIRSSMVGNAITKMEVDVFSTSGGLNSGKHSITTAGWQALFKLVTLQSCIIDNQLSLRDIIRKIDSSLNKDPVSHLKREISERELRLSVLQNDTNQSVQASTSLREKIHQVKINLARRRDVLAIAKEQERFDISRNAEISEDIIDEQIRFHDLQTELPSARALHITTLSSIYPIELLSPPDLLYTILDVPLPIPLSPNDPAPPLSLTTHKEVTDEAVAAALGYAAQVLQLLSAYLQKSLIYPVTCIGSRSLIRDDISAMVGPRMFPLFSKGVDIYRFEYGVYLLNKDVEMLMMDRNLRALDMRHTLPNLKNLMLTLTDGTEFTAHSLPNRVPVSVSEDLDSMSLASQEDSSSATVKKNAEEDAADVPAFSSGSTTPIAADTRSKPRSFLGLAPLTGFLRSHYYPSPTSSVSSAKNNDCEEIENVGGSANIADDDGEDRRTIRGTDSEAREAMGVLPTATPIIDTENAREKLGGEESHRHSLARTIPSMFSNVG